MEAQSSRTADAPQYFVDEPRCVERVVDVPYEVVVERQLENVIENVQYIDKHVEVDVRRVVEVPVEVVREQRRVSRVLRPVEVERVVDRIVERVEEVPVEVLREVLVPVERRVTREVEQVVLRPFRLEGGDGPARREQLVEVPLRSERVELVAVEQERLVEQPAQERTLERVVELERVVDRPVLTTRIVDVPVERVVDVFVEKPVVRVVEVPRLVEQEEVIEVVTRVHRPVPRPVEAVCELRSSTTTFRARREQREAFLAWGEELFALGAEAARLDEQLHHAHALLGQCGGLDAEELRRRNAELRVVLRGRGEAPAAQEAEEVARRLREQNAQLQRSLCLAESDWRVSQSSLLSEPRCSAPAPPLATRCEHLAHSVLVDAQTCFEYTTPTTFYAPSASTQAPSDAGWPPAHGSLSSSAAIAQRF